MSTSKLVFEKKEQLELIRVYMLDKLRTEKNPSVKITKSQAESLKLCQEQFVHSLLEKVFF